MAVCPEIEIYTSEDPFLTYARNLIKAFKNVYGTERYSRGGKNVFEYSSEMWDRSKYLLVRDDHDLSSVKSRKVISAVNWETSLPLYIKGPGWGTDVFSDYSEESWDIKNSDEEGWFDLAGELAVHPMLNLDFDRYYSGGADYTREGIIWDDYFRGKPKIQGAFSIEGTTSAGTPIPQVMDLLKFGFIMEILAGFIHIHDEIKDRTGEVLIKPGMEPFTWCQMVWSGYEDSFSKDYLGLGSDPEVYDVEQAAWDGDLDPPASFSRIIYVPRYDTDDVVDIPKGPVHANSALRTEVGYGRPLIIQGLSVKILNAGYSDFLYWLRRALDLLDSDSLGPIDRGPARTGLDGEDFYSQVLINGGRSALSTAECQATGAPYGGTFEDDLTTNTCNIKIFRAMADLLYFDDNPMSENLPDDELDYWNKFLDEHSVSISLSTEALNEAILGSGVDGYCDAVLLDYEASGLDFQGINVYARCRVDSDDLQDLLVEPELTCIPDPQAIVPNWINQPEGEPFFNKKVCEYSIVMFADPPSCSEEYFASF